MVVNGEIVEERTQPNGRRKTDMEKNRQTILWTIIAGVATAGIVAGAGFTWSTHTAMNEMKISLNQMCVAMPELKSRIDKHDLELERGKIADEAMKGRMYYLEESLKMFEKRIDRYMK